MSSLLKPEASTVAGVAAGALAVGIYSICLPSLAECRTGEVGDVDLNAAEKGALFASAGVVAGVSLLAKDPTIFMVGGATVLCLSLLHRHANAVDPSSGKVPHWSGGMLGRSDDEG